MVIKKRGMFFTIMTIIVLAIFLASYSLYTGIKDRSTIEKRVLTLNSFLDSLEQDIPRELYVSGFRSIVIFEKHIVETGSFIQNSSASFQELIYNGTLYGEQQQIMQGATISDIQTSISSKGTEINANITLTPQQVTISQEDPWRIKISFTTGIKVNDKSGLASWNVTKTFVSYIPVEGFEDPLYVIGTNGFVTNKINRTAYQPFTQGSDVSNLLLHAQGSYYIETPLAPSFLNKLEGNMTSNPNGIESIVNLQQLSAQGITVKDKSVVDYIYFSTNNPTKHNIQGMPSWFKLDDAHLSLYGVTNLTTN